MIWNVPPRGVDGRRNGREYAEGKPEGGKVPVAKAVFGEQTAIVVNDVIAMRTAHSYAKSNRPTLIGSGGHRSGGVMVNKSEHEKRTILWSDPFTIGQDSLGRKDTNAVTVWLPVSATFQYDANGNLLSDGKRGFVYDDENQLTRVTVTNAWKTEFQYDGKMRLRVRKEYAWRSGSFTPTNEVRYVYDGMLVIQERNANNIPVANYTRGLDLSSSRQGAGGIGGLLARTDSGLWNGSGTDGAHTYYSADGNGNVTCLLNSRQIVVGRYVYDPYGNTLSLSGPQAEANPYRFSSKEYMVNSGLYAYGYRFYEPSLQRWLNRDPIGERGGINLYGFVGNKPIYLFDPWGELDAISAYNDWVDTSASGYYNGGIGGYLQWVGGGLGAATIDFWGARLLQKNSESSGAAAGYRCYFSAIKYGALAFGQIGLTAGGQYAVNAALYPFFRFIGPGSAAGFGAGTWLARGPIGEVPYNNIVSAMSKLQIPPQSGVNRVVNATENVWYKYVAGPRVVSGNPQWGAGGGAEYRVGGF